jgi:DNA-binding NarL/FixJ family response regulator
VQVSEDNQPMTDTETIRLLIVDDQELMRDGLIAVLERQPGIIVVGAAGNGSEALEQIEQTAPDVVLMDVRMPVMDGVQATREIRTRMPHVHVLMLTTFDDEEYIVHALKAGAAGYILKNIPARELAESIRMAHKGILQLAPTAAAKVVAQLRAPLSAPVIGLTQREREVMLLVAQGASNREIAEQLVISEGTVKSHISSILSQLGLRDRTQIAVYAHQQGTLR